MQPKGEAERVQGILFKIPLDEPPIDLNQLLTAKVPDATKKVAVGRQPDLADHLAELAIEFSGDPQINFFHAVLNVLIRRDVQKQQAVRHFDALWEEHGDHLLSSLSARWLVSACDTLMDCSHDPVERALACTASTLMNTIKLYETERLSNGPAAFHLEELARPVSLFDGMTSFSVGYGDMIRNLRERTRAICARDTVAAKIVLELLSRADRANTIYYRLATIHRVDGTRWH